MTAESTAAAAAVVESAAAGLPVVDPFGLWQPPILAVPAAAQPGMAASEGLSFGLPGGSGPEEAPVATQPAAAGPNTEPAAVWTLPLTSSGGIPTGEQELERRAGQIQVINQGLDEAAARVEAFLSSHARQQQSAGAPPIGAAASFSVEPAPSPVFAPETSAPELDLAYALASLAPAAEATEATEAISFGVGEEAVRQALVNWEDMRQRANALFDGVNRQLLNFAWVDTTLDGLLVARTAVHWGGDMITLWQPGLPPEQCNAHCRSLDLAMASRSANLRTILTVSQVAGKIALAVSTPLGTVQALALGWQFVSQVVMPMLKQVG